MRTNYLGSVWCLRAFLPGLEAAAPADIVNVVSVSGSVTFPPSGPYSASKFAQLAFSRSVAVQLRERGITVHTVKPGFAETEGFPQGRLPAPVRRIVIGPGEGRGPRPRLARPRAGRDDGSVVLRPRRRASGADPERRGVCACPSVAAY